MVYLAIMGAVFMKSRFYHNLQASLAKLESEGLAKHESALLGAQGVTIETQTPSTAPLTSDCASQLHTSLNLCANNYLSLANHPRLIAAAKKGLDSHGFGMASVRFICGTQDIHLSLEARLSAFLGFEDTILFSSCFDANTALFEALLGENDAVVSDALNHASIIDGIRLCKAQRYRYRNNDMHDLEAQLQQARAQGAQTVLIATDGVFSMDGVIADLRSICQLAEQYDALVMVDDSHAVGFIGPNGRGTPEFCGVEGHVDILTGTLGKALGGGSGGYVSAKKEVVSWLRQRARPYLFSNALAPSIVCASLEALDIVQNGAALRQQLQDNSERFRRLMTEAGFQLGGAGHPIIPVMIGEAQTASGMAQRLRQEGIYVVAFSYPVVPMGQARIRTQMSSAHTAAQIDHAVAVFSRIGRELGLIA